MGFFSSRPGVHFNEKTSLSISPVLGDIFIPRKDLLAKAMDFIEEGSGHLDDEIRFSLRCYLNFLKIPQAWPTDNQSYAIVDFKYSSMGPSNLSSRIQHNFDTLIYHYERPSFRKNKNSDWISKIARSHCVLSKSPTLVIFALLLDIPVIEERNGQFFQRKPLTEVEQEHLLYGLLTEGIWRLPPSLPLEMLPDILRDLAPGQKLASLLSDKIACFGFSKWKRKNLRKALRPSKLRFFEELEKGVEWGFQRHANLLCWSSKMTRSAKETDISGNFRILHMEDGFIRSKGLGAHLTPAQSLVIDRQGIYYDPNQPSDLETFLNAHNFTHDERERAQKLRSTILEKQLNKYNLQNSTIDLPPSDRESILVPGQVEDDASIFKGTGPVKTNLELLKQVRTDFPEARIIYKPHPDVELAQRQGELSRDRALSYADLIIREGTIDQIAPLIDQVATMTSLLGFEALLRDVAVTTYGAPFYAGWGLTSDKYDIKFQRRTRKLKLEELIFGALIEYPFYFDSNFCPVSPETYLENSF
ncbi:MAG: hypothetical protein MI743_12435 [Sneathiellales bacterium]|nr:hypothetical protein [Sneathiellales bacterium]